MELSAPLLTTTDQRERSSVLSERVGPAWALLQRGLAQRARDRQIWL